MNRRGFFRTLVGLAGILIPATLTTSEVTEVAAPEVFEKNFFQCGYTGDKFLRTGHMCMAPNNNYSRYWGGIL